MDLLDCLDQRVTTLRADGGHPVQAMREKINRASSWLDSVELILSQRFSEASVDRQDWDLASFRLFLAIQESIDLSAHWIAGTDWGIPKHAASAFDMLADHAVIDRDLAARLRAVVILRDLISHGDFTENRESLQGTYREGTASLRRFLAAVAEKAGI